MRLLTMLVYFRVCSFSRKKSTPARLLGSTWLRNFLKIPPCFLIRGCSFIRQVRVDERQYFNLIVEICTCILHAMFTTLMNGVIPRNAAWWKPCVIYLQSANDQSSLIWVKITHCTVCDSESPAPQVWMYTMGESWFELRNWLFL